MGIRMQMRVFLGFQHERPLDVRGLCVSKTCSLGCFFLLESWEVPKWGWCRRGWRELSYECIPLWGETFFAFSLLFAFLRFPLLLRALGAKTAITEKRETSQQPHLHRLSSKLTGAVRFYGRSKEKHHKQKGRITEGTGPMTLLGEGSHSMHPLPQAFHLDFVLLSLFPCL